MKILITGTQGLARELANVHHEDHVVCVSRRTGHNIELIDHWGSEFLNYDRVYNCAYSGSGQQKVLEFFYQSWQDLNEKSIINIGSKVITQPRIELERDREFWPYRVHKQTLQNYCDTMWPTACCDLKIINPGAIDTEMIKMHNINKMNPIDLAKKIKEICEDRTIKRVDLWL